MAAAENITRIAHRNKELILLSTAHVSKESAALVKEVIESEKPDSVCIELDEDRYRNLKDKKAWENTDIIQVIKAKKVGFLLVNLALSSYQKRIAGQLNTRVGLEMITGMEGAEKTGANLVLADRNIQTTFLRIWRNMNFIEKLKLLTGLFFSFDKEDSSITDEEIQALLEKDMLESVISEMHVQFPKIGEILIHERDQYLAAKIKEAPGPKVVAVLGAAHVPGIIKELDQIQDLDKISTIPPKTFLSKAAGFIIPTAILLLIACGFASSLQTGLQQLTAWVLWNGILAALFAALSLAHPFSILTAFFVAPISSLNPFLACGWFSGLVEASLRKPTVQDVNRVPEDILSLRGFFKNRFLRILLVVIMSNLGSTIGTFVAGLDIIQRIFQ